MLLQFSVAAVAAGDDGRSSLLPSADEARTRYADEYPVIGYATTPPSGPIARLQAALEAGEAALEYDVKRGYLPAVLDLLGIDGASQLLVFSKTSLNKALITPENPRAIYFNDNSYVAWVPGSGMLEIATMDPQLGPLFYVLEQKPVPAPRFDRQTVQCLQCHDSLTMTGGGVPRFILGSGYIDTRGALVSHEGWILTGQQTPLRFRWGGWYVTGGHGEQPHLGNIIVRDVATLQQLDSLRIYNRQELGAEWADRPYPGRHSDIVALLVIEHQVHVQNLITRVNYDVRTALAASGRAAGVDNKGNDQSITAETKSLIEEAAEPLVKAMLFAGEADLGAAISGSNEFASRFEQRGPFDSRGRSLREFDLRTRTFRYPLSYLVYSPAFDALPAAVRAVAYRRFVEVFAGMATDEDLPRLSAKERDAMRSILRETKPEFAAFERGEALREEEQQ